MFVGMLAAALTEVLNVLPILAKRIGFGSKIIILLMAIVFGKIAKLFISLAVFYPSFIRRNRRDKLKRKLQNKSERLSAETAICLELRQSLSDRRFDLSDRAGSSRLLHPLF